MSYQNLWRYCQNCHAMFYDGYADKGHCSAGGGHVAQGFMFFLPHDVAGTATTQNDWRYCQNCHVMFYDGYPDKGHCAAGGGHQAQGLMFGLPHDIPPTGTAQDAWRFCDHCSAMFYDGYADKGNCPAGGGHHAQGYMFVLPHDISTVLRWDQNSITFSGGTPVDGNAHLTIIEDGAFTFWGHFHDSGGTSYDVSAMMSVKDSQNRLYTFAKSGHVAGTFESGSRDFDWNVPGHNQAIADNWISLAAGATFSVHSQSDLNLSSLLSIVEAGAGYVGEVIEVLS